MLEWLIASSLLSEDQSAAEKAFKDRICQESQYVKARCRACDNYTSHEWKYKLDRCDGQTSSVFSHLECRICGYSGGELPKTQPKQKSKPVKRNGHTFVDGICITCGRSRRACGKFKWKCHNH